MAVPWFTSCSSVCPFFMLILMIGFLFGALQITGISVSGITEIADFSNWQKTASCVLFFFFVVESDFYSRERPGFKLQDNSTVQS